VWSFPGAQIFRIFIRIRLSFEQATITLFSSPFVRMKSPKDESFHTRRQFLRTSHMGGALAPTVPLFFEKTFLTPDSMAAATPARYPTGKVSTVLCVRIASPGGAKLTWNRVNVGWKEVHGTIVTPRGLCTVKADWKSQRFSLNLPPGCSTNITLPANNRSGAKTWRDVRGVFEY
jgi:hypothetical protein